ncbi:MAG: hypothetical protein HYU36_17980 [Planctomycetes bacterium]|nr:hypothetical protein [Planctomycetota bacterium]
MIVDSTHTRWIILSVAILVVGLITYVPYHATTPGGPGGGTFQGLIYGFVGTAMMVFAGLLGARKRVRIWRLGRAQEWVRAHIWLGLISFPIILFHAGMSFGRGSLTSVLMWLFAIVILSGILGLVIQHVLPRMLLDRVPRETVYEQVPRVIDQLRQEADTLIESVSGVIDHPEQPAFAEASSSPGRRAHDLRTRATALAVPVEGSDELKRFYLIEVRPFFHPEGIPEGELMGAKTSSARFGRIRLLLPRDLHDTLRDLETLCEERRELALQQKLHHWLHGWLLVHIPIAYALLLLSVIHALMSLFY